MTAVDGSALTRRTGPMPELREVALGGRSVGGRIGVVTPAAGDFGLTMDELRVVARFAADSAQDVLPV